MQIDGTNSRTEDLLVTGVEETKKPLSRAEAILRGEDVKPLSRIEKALKEGGGGSTSNDVTQTSINDSERHRLILSNSGTDNTEVAGVYKNNKLTFNPKASRLFIGYNTLSTGDTSINGSIQLQQKDQVSETSTVLTALTGIASDSPIFDVTLIEDTWDGTNHSLKDAIANAGSSYSEVTGTLVSGSTSITLTDSNITTDSTIDIYSSIWGADPTDVTVANGSITLTFEAQETDMNVKVRVS